MNDYSLGAKPVTIGGNGAIINSDSLRNLTMVRYITLNGPGTVGGQGDWYMMTTNTDVNRFDPSVAGIDTFLQGNGNTLTKTGNDNVNFLNVGETSLGDIIVTKGTLTFAYLSTLGYAANKLVIYPGAQVAFSGVTVNNPNPNNLTKNVFMTNGTLQCINSEADLYGNITLVSNNTFDVENNGSIAPFYIYSSVSGPGQLTKIGDEPLIISGAALHTGGTLVGAGNLQVDGTLGTGAATVVVTNAATGIHPVPGTLCGIGIVKDAVNIQSNGIVQPGDPGGLNGGIGILTISNSLTLQPGSSAVLKVNRSTATNDVLNVTGSLTYSGNLLVSNTVGAPYVVGNSFKMFNAGSYLGSFQSISPSSPGSGLNWDTSRLTVNGTLYVVKAPPTLTNLVISPAGTLSPLFTTNNLGYAATNAYGNNPVTVTAYAADPSSTLQLSFNGGAYGPLTNGIASLARTLVLPTNTVAVKVTAADASTNQTYMVNVTLQPNLAPAKLTNSVNGSSLTFAWPADHLGWVLQMQTNTLGVGLKTNGWVSIPGTDSVTQTNISIIKTNPTVFFRMTYPNQ
jgi:hypothetical protein